jgi:hypothetical protein
MMIGFARSDPDYARSWRDLRRREAAFWIVVLSYLPGVALALLAVHLIRHDVPEHFALWVGGGWIATYVMANLYRLGFRCPRCRCSFFRPRMEQSGHAPTCAHCNLPRGAPQDPDAQSLDDNRERLS